MEKELQKIYLTYRLIDSARFMASSLSNIVNNPSEGIHEIKCKYVHGDKNYETCEIKYKYFLEYIYFKIDLIKYKCLLYNKNCQTNSNEKLKDRFFNTYKFSNHNNNKLILLL